MPSWELTLAEVRGMSMPAEPEPMTEEKWAALEAVLHPVIVNLNCQLCKGNVRVLVYRGSTFETYMWDEIEDAHKSGPCPECSKIDLAAILAYHFKVWGIAR